MSPRTPEQLQHIRERRMQQIKDAALRLFAREGYANTTISKIAQEAGVSKGLMYNYFQSKEELLMAILEDGFAFAGELMDRFEPGEDVADHLRYMIEQTFAHVSAYADYWRLYISLAFQPAVSEAVGRMMERGVPGQLLAFTREAFRQMGHPQAEEEAWLLAATLDGIFMHAIQIGEEYPLERMKEYVLRRFLPSAKR